MCNKGLRWALMENRNGLLVDLQVTPATGTAGPEAAEAMLKRQARKGIQPQTLGSTPHSSNRALGYSPGVA
jgi:hypothetical protein